MYCSESVKVYKAEIHVGKYICCHESEVASFSVGAMFLWGRNYVPVGLKLCSCGVKTMFSWGRSYVPNVVML